MVSLGVALIWVVPIKATGVINVSENALQLMKHGWLKKWSSSGNFIFQRKSLPIRVMPTPANYNEKIVRTTKDVWEILNKVTFEKSVLDFKWHFGVKEVTIASSERGASDTVKNDRIPSDKNAWLIWGIFERPDTNTGLMGEGRGRDEIIYMGTTESGVVKTAWVIVEMLVRHELMEAFRYEGIRPFDPHNQISALNSLQDGRED